MSGQLGACVSEATILETSTPTIPPLNHPATAVTHPTPMLRAERDSTARSFSPATPAP
jgi:hypothetical protein